MSEVVYSSTVTSIGDLVPGFAEQGLLVFFGQNAPRELHEFSIIHSPQIQIRAPEVGDKISLAESVYQVLAVGNVVSENLLHLGHLDLKANGLAKPEMPGDVNVEKLLLPTLKIGDRLTVISHS